MEKIINKIIAKNKKILQSLREYDEGKKDINTSKLEKLC